MMYRTLIKIMICLKHYKHGFFFFPAEEFYQTPDTRH